MPPPRAVLALLLLAGSSSFGNQADVQRVPLPIRGPLYFFKDGHTHASYLELRGNGTYREINVQHLLTEQSDAGQWEVRGSDLLLHSRNRPIHVETPEFLVYLFDRAQYRNLPRLSATLRAFLRHQRSPAIPFTAIKEISVPLPNSRRKLGVSLDIDFEFDAKRPEAQRETIERLIRAIDHHVRRRDAFTHRFRFVRYRQSEWLEAFADEARWTAKIAGAIATIETRRGSPPDYRYVRISKGEFEKGAASLYPFKHYPEMNEKVRALQPKR